MTSLKVDQKFQPPLEKISGYATGYQLLLITNRKSHGLSTGTDLNDVERRIALI